MNMQTLQGLKVFATGAGVLHSQHLDGVQNSSVSNAHTGDASSVPLPSSDIAPYNSCFLKAESSAVQSMQPSNAGVTFEPYFSLLGLSALPFQMNVLRLYVILPNLHPLLI